MESLESIERQGSAPVGKLLFEYSLPAVVGLLSSALYEVVDRILLGRGVGTEAIAAVTCAFPLAILAVGIGVLLGTGAGNLISKLLGEGRTDEAERVLGQSLRMAVLVGGAVAIAYIRFAPQLLRLCGAEGQVLEMASSYLRIIAVGHACLVATFAMGNIIRVQGRPGLSLLFLVGGNVLNVLLVSFAIFGLGLGVPGAAGATALAAAVNLGALLLFLQSRASHLRVRRRHLVFDRGVSLSIITLGAPVYVMQILGGLLFLSANRAAAAVEGARGVAAVGVFNTLALLLVYPAFGVAQAMQPLVAFNLGAARLDRVRALLGRALAANLAIGFTIAGAVCLAPRTMAALFTRSDLHLLELVERGVPWVMCSVALFGASATVSHYFLAMQRPQPAGLLLAGRQILCAAAFALLPRFLGISGLYLAPLFADLPIALLSLYMMRSEWRRLPRAPGSEAAADYAAS